MAREPEEYAHPTLVDGSEITLHSHTGGGSLSYTELDGSDTTTASTQGASDGQWVAWDISAIVPVGTAVAEVLIRKMGATDDVGVRKESSSLAREVNVLKFGIAILNVEVESNRIIGIMSDDVSDDDIFSIMGYWS